MAASKTAITKWNLAAYQDHIWSFVSDDSGDWFVLDVPGVVCPLLCGDTGAVMTQTYGVVVVNNKGTAYTATDTSIVYDGGSPASMTRKTGGFFVMASTGSEIMWVSNDSGYAGDSGTLTVIRGCLGTTAAAASVADDVVLNVLNVIVSGTDIDGRGFMRGIALPNEPKALVCS